MPRKMINLAEDAPDAVWIDWSVADDDTDPEMEDYWLEPRDPAIVRPPIKYVRAE